MGCASPDSELLAAFENGTISRDRWTHRAHVRVAYLYARDHEPKKAISRMRTGLLALNKVHEVPDVLDRGYHETITVAFMRLIHSALRQHDPGTSEEFCQRHPELLKKAALEQFYSRERLMTAKAKVSFVEPDLAALPD